MLKTSLSLAMLHKTEGVVFRYVKFKETSIIVSIYTELFGLQSYIVNGVRSASAKGKIALYQPLTLLDMVVYHRDQANIHRIHEAKCLYAYQSISTHVFKSSIALFLTEILNKSIREEGHSPGLAHFLIDSFRNFDTMKLGIENFHLHFLIQLTQYLGFRPYHAHEVYGSGVLTTEEDAILTELLRSNHDVSVVMNLAQRRNILDVILRFYAAHIEHLGEIRSLPVLRTLME